MLSIRQLTGCPQLRIAHGLAFSYEANQYPSNPPHRVVLEFPENGP